MSDHDVLVRVKVAGVNPPGGRCGYIKDEGIQSIF
jgi:hypothetical protein